MLKNRWRYRLSDLWYTFFHPAVLWLEGAEDTYFHGEYSFSGVSDPWGVPWDPFFVLPLKSLILHQVGVFACWRRVFCWKCLKPSPGGLQDRLSLPIEEKKFSLTCYPKTIGILSKYWAAPISPAHGVKWYFQGLRSWKIIFVVGS